MASDYFGNGRFGEGRGSSGVLFDESMSVSDIMGELLNEAPEAVEGADPALDELDKFLKRMGDEARKPKPAKAKAKKPAARKSARPAKRTRRKKTTQYLTRDMFDQLGDSRKAIRAMVPSELQYKISKSRIVNCSLRIALEDFLMRRERSEIVERLLSNLLD